MMIGRIMIGRIILTVVVLILNFVVINAMEQKVAPDHVTRLVIEGVENVGVMEGNQAQVRIEQNAQNWLLPVVSLTAVGLLFLIWEKPATKVFNCGS